jgi:hypothetical protein
VNDHCKSGVRIASGYGIYAGSIRASIDIGGEGQAIGKAHSSVVAIVAAASVDKMRVPNVSPVAMDRIAVAPPPSLSIEGVSI